MNYEIVNLEDKTVAGIAVRTSNSSPDMPKAIGSLWYKYYNEGVYQSIPDKKNDKNICLYTNYESDVSGHYDAVVCCEIEKTAELPVAVQTRTIQAGRYAKFIVKGDAFKAISEFWSKLWGMELNRKYTSDFEEYQSGSDMSNAEVHVYIALT